MPPQKKTPAKKKYPVKAKDVPVTQAMLYGVRSELIAKMNSKFRGVDAQFSSLDARFALIDSRFNDMEARFALIDSRFNQIDARFAQIDARFAQTDAKIDAMHGEIIRIGVLVEEQNARNAIVLEGLKGLFHRQERVETRTDAMERILENLSKIGSRGLT